MIVFSYENEEFFIDDDFKVEGGKDKDIFEKDIDIFLMDKTPASGDIVVQYAGHLEKDVGAKVKLVENKKYPKGTLDVSEYEDEPKNNSKDISSILEEAFGTFKNYIASRLENGGDGSGNFNHAGRPGEVGGSAKTIKDTRNEGQREEY